MSASLAVELLAEYPALLAVVALVTRFALAWQTQLTYAEYRIIHRFKRGVFPIVDRVAGGAILWVSEKGDREDAEYITTVKAPYREVVNDLRKSGGSLHLLNSLKRRPEGNGDTLTIAHVVWTHDDGAQTEAYLFDNYGSTDVYAHVEPSPQAPLEHLAGKQLNGDTRGVVAEALD
jgi:hypothetical protein